MKLRKREERIKNEGVVIRSKDKNRLKVNVHKIILHINSNQKRAEGAVPFSDKIYFITVGISGSFVRSPLLSLFRIFVIVSQLPPIPHLFPFPAS